MTEVVPNQAYDAWNVKSLLFIPVFLFSEDYVRKGVLHDLKEIRSEERIAFGNSLSEKRRESHLIWSSRRDEFYDRETRMRKLRYSAM